jgi:hypothetical protein
VQKSTALFRRTVYSYVASSPSAPETPMLKIVNEKPATTGRHAVTLLAEDPGDEKLLLLFFNAIEDNGLRLSATMQKHSGSKFSDLLLEEIE